MIDQACPRCNDALISYPVARGEAARCAGCSGIHADGRALRSISGAGVVAAVMEMAGQGETADIPCSGCGEPMRVVAVGGVVVDVCPDDELVWLDGGEMAGFRPGLRDQTVHDPAYSVPPGLATSDLVLAIMLQWP